MATATDLQLSRVTPVELVEAVRSGRIRYPSPRSPSAADVAKVLDGIHRRYPQTSLLLLWQNPADGAEAPRWLLDGGNLVSALLRAAGATAEQSSAEPVYLDTDSGEIVAWGQRPDRRHLVLDVKPLLAAEDVDAYLSSEHLAGPRADQVRAFVRSLREHHIPMQVVDFPRSELPRLFRHLRMRSGVSFADIDPPSGQPTGPPASWFAWRSEPRSLVIMARSTSGSGIPDEALWRALLVAEGRDPKLLYDDSAASSDLPDDGRPAVRAVRSAHSFLRGVVGYPSGKLFPEADSLAAVARFLRVFPDVDRAIWPMLRRWVWRIALADGDLDLTPSALSVIREDAAQSAVRLLETAPIPAPIGPGRVELDITGRRGRQVLLGLASLHPRDLSTGVLVDVDAVTPRVILRDRGTEAANLLIHDAPWSGGSTTLREAVETATDPELLASHGIDEVAVDLLRDGDDEAFLARRSATLDRAVLEFWATMIEPSARTRRPVALLFEDDDGA